MSSCSRVALVTGADKGIGFAITRELCRQFSGDVVLTAPDARQGRAAVQQLLAEGLSPRFHQLDIDDQQSIRALRDFLREAYGGLDVLVNNAGIAFKTADPTPFHIQAEVTMKTNFFGTQAVCKELLPLIKPRVFQLQDSSSFTSLHLASTSPQEITQEYLQMQGKHFHSSTPPDSAPSQHEVVKVVVTPYPSSIEESNNRKRD